MPKKGKKEQMRVAEPTVEYGVSAPPALGEVFWLAFQSLDEDAKSAFLSKLLEDPEMREDLYDSILSLEARGEPTRPYAEIRKELVRDGLL